MENCWALKYNRTHAPHDNALLDRKTFLAVWLAIVYHKIKSIGFSECLNKASYSDDKRRQEK